MWKAFERGAGIQIGTWTGDQMEHGDLVWHNPNYEDVFSLDMQQISGAKRGDLVFWGTSDNPAASTHVEMYLGDDPVSYTHLDVYKRQMLRYLCLTA